MKKILCIALVLFASISSFAQEKTIEKTEFDKVYQLSFKKRAGKSLRTITTTVQSVEGRPESGYSSKSTAEVQPGVGYRSIYEAALKSGNIKNERIVIGNNVFVREGDSEWKEGAMEPPAPRPESKFTTIENKIEYKFLGSEKLGDRQANIFATTEQNKSVEKATGVEISSTVTIKYWFREDGELSKMERLTKSRLGDRVTNYQVITVYEADPNIKIEAPELKPLK